MKKARKIVNDIFQEIEKRANDRPFDDSLLQELNDKRRAIEDRITLDFSRSVPAASIAKIRETLGSELLDCLEQGKLGVLGKKAKDRLVRVYKKLATLVEFHRFYTKEVQTAELRIACLEHIKNELVESQVAHVHELELLDERLVEHHLLVRMVLAPFEDAVKQFLRFLDAKQIEVFLFDDDKFLAAELKTDGETFRYDMEEEHPPLPEAVSEVTLQEVQETSLDVPLVVEGEQIGHYRITRQSTDGFDKDGWKKTVESVTPVLARIIEANRNRVQARKVYIDDLTRLYNKRKLNEQMGKLFKQFKRGEKKLFIVMMDIDHFKVLNDTYGHPVGDRVLQQTAALIKNAIPHAYRYGGEEFAGIFYGYTKEHTLELIENVRRTIETTPYAINKQEYHITISAGVAEFETSMNSVMDAIDRADQALYASKEDGRNRCTFYDDVKHRLTADAAKLRQEILRLKEQMKRMADLEEQNKKLTRELKQKKQRK